MKKLPCLLLVFFLNFSEQNSLFSFWDKTIGPTSQSVNVLFYIDSTHLLAGTNDDGIYFKASLTVSWSKASGCTKEDIRAFALKKSNNNIFAASFGGGIFISSNSGISWQQSINGLTSLEILSIAVNESDGNILAGTNGDGLYKSSDNGLSWKKVNYAFANNYFTALAVKSNGYIFAGAEKTGIYRSTDNGANWTKLNSGTDNFQVTSIAISKLGFVYAATDTGVFRSIDDGLNWSLSGNNQTFSFNCLFSVKNPKSFVGSIYAGTKEGIYYIYDIENSWSKLPERLDNMSINSIASDDSGSVFLASTPYEIYYYKDSYAYNKYIQDNIDFRRTSVLSLSLDELGNIVYAGTDGFGVFSSSDNGESWDSRSRKLPDYGKIISMSNCYGDVFAGVFGNGLWKYNDSIDIWENVAIGTSVSKVNAIITNNWNVFIGTEQGVFQSTDIGKNWTPSNTGLPPANRNILTLAARDKGDYIFAGLAGDGVFRRFKTSNQWADCNNNLSPDSVYSIIVADNGYVFLSNPTGVYRSVDNGSTWQQMSSGLLSTPKTLFAADSLHIYAGLRTQDVYVSTNYGTNWVRIGDNGLGNVTTNAFIVDSRGYLYSGTIGDGVYRSSGPIKSNLLQISINCSDTVKTFWGGNINFIITVTDNDNKPVDSATINIATSAINDFPTTSLITDSQGKAFYSANIRVGAGIGINYLQFYVSKKSYTDSRIVKCFVNILPLRIKFPNGGEKFTVGDTITITWENLASDEKVYLFYSTNNGKTFDYQIGAEESGLSFKWEGIPNTPSDSCKAKVEVFWKEGIDEFSLPDISDGVWSISPQAPAIIEAEDYDFGDVTIDFGEFGTVDVYNRGTNDLTLFGYTQPKDTVFKFTNGSFPYIIKPGEKYTYNIDFNPTEEKQYNDTIWFLSDAASGDSLCILTGRGVKPGLVANSYDWGRRRIKKGPYFPDNAQEVIKLTNTGTQDVDISSMYIISQTNGNAFIIDSNDFKNLTIPALDYITVPVSFNPMITGECELIIGYNNTAGSTTQTRLAGIGVVPRIQTQNVDFGSTIANDLTNPQKRTVSFTCINWQYGDSLTISDFTILPNGDEIGTNGVNLGLEGFVFDKGSLKLPRILQPGESLTFDAFFVALHSGTHQAILKSLSDAESNAESVWQGENIPQIISMNDDSANICISNPDTLVCEVENKGPGIIVIAMADIVPSIPEFTIIDPGFPIMLDSGEKLPIEIVFNSLSEGFWSSELVVLNSTIENPTIKAKITGSASDCSLNINLPTNLNGKPGEIIEVPINIENLDVLIKSGATEINFEIRFNASMLEPYGSTAKGELRFNNSENILERIIQFQFPINDSIPSFQLRATLGDDTTTALSIENIEVFKDALPMQINANPISGLFTLSGVCKEGGARLLSSAGQVSLMLARPNPSGESCVVEFETTEKGLTKLIIVDAVGSTVQTLLYGSISRGKHSIDLNLKTLPPGNYFVILRTPTIVRTVNIEVIR